MKYFQWKTGFSLTELLVYHVKQYHGGTNFGRTAGGPFITTSYDYDAPIDEYGEEKKLFTYFHVVCSIKILKNCYI